ncbi:hypothetical protein EHI8A_135070 [Entamoeba histolytica HM-1:IMSS-B]|uniref:Uncharacterized protein n=5 Tax=Entamoeba histolytica TaxID=5759 RepID=C4M3C8_ENTH1|nr:hypothetical protein EHI_053100 [Entamoeba histolytica HM-1:IMSS]EMH74828.1 hypothetical protein EHI8A_135070 [Entamoeba histolytica HM-1:IMSS-B]EMS11895.1 hypothetical protein KM1_218120 [Entamoeba histolytica HM-3:IMSS]ENY64082.1 hypothetical protein EHI7A_125070 [Entamoeba histolytica HM-1:IMSS-A]GAT95813.1 hypothetical protein CL6EHI_053100 [Entamoeba histolytica]EAL51746.1 hypothetical protein EHI_053100 [Entamoeba histolytica HM-1:IMSS]|eukprot:XP_657130.1 hypothetical protein EHI_053100 [Entamoeba histolytica HM-1:IMSS]
MSNQRKEPLSEDKLNNYGMSSFSNVNSSYIIKKIPQNPFSDPETTTLYHSYDNYHPFNHQTSFFQPRSVNYDQSDYQPTYDSFDYTQTKELQTLSIPEIQQSHVVNSNLPISVSPVQTNKHLGTTRKQTLTHKDDEAIIMSKSLKPTAMIEPPKLPKRKNELPKRKKQYKTKDTSKPYKVVPLSLQTKPTITFEQQVILTKENQISKSESFPPTQEENISLNLEGTLTKLPTSKSSTKPETSPINHSHIFNLTHITSSQSIPSQSPIYSSYPLNSTTSYNLHPLSQQINSSGVIEPAKIVVSPESSIDPQIDKSNNVQYRSPNSLILPPLHDSTAPIVTHSPMLMKSNSIIQLPPTKVSLKTNSSENEEFPLPSSVPLTSQEDLNQTLNLNDSSLAEPKLIRGGNVTRNVSSKKVHIFNLKEKEDNQQDLSDSITTPLAQITQEKIVMNIKEINKIDKSIEVEENQLSEKIRLNKKFQKRSDGPYQETESETMEKRKHTISLNEKTSMKVKEIPSTISNEESIESSKEKEEIIEQADLDKLQGIDTRVFTSEFKLFRKKEAKVFSLIKSSMEKENNKLFGKPWKEKLKTEPSDQTHLFINSLTLKYINTQPLNNEDSTIEEEKEVHSTEVLTNTKPETNKENDLNNTSNPLTSNDLETDTYNKEEIKETDKEKEQKSEEKEIINKENIELEDLKLVNKKKKKSTINKKEQQSDFQKTEDNSFDLPSSIGGIEKVEPEEMKDQPPLESSTINESSHDLVISKKQSKRSEVHEPTEEQSKFSDSVLKGNYYLRPRDSRTSVDIYQPDFPATRTRSTKKKIKKSVEKKTGHEETEEESTNVRSTEEEQTKKRQRYSTRKKTKRRISNKTLKSKFQEIDQSNSQKSEEEKPKRKLSKK